MEVPVEWLELRDDGTIVAKIKQKSGTLPMTVSLEQLHKAFPTTKNINSSKALIGLLKRRGGTFDLPNIKIGRNKRESRLVVRKEEARWNA